MPNHGRSGRCLTCKRRHVKCDKTRPACSPCRRLRLVCGGYRKEYTFRPARTLTSAAFRAQTRWPSQQQEQRRPEPSRSLLTGADVAVPFFLVHYAGMGRRLAAARGFYETLIPLYTSQLTDSPLTLAVAAVAARIFALWRHGDAAHGDRHAYAQAIASLRSALQHPEDRGRPATSLAILALHLDESIGAVYGARQAQPLHHHGALSLLPVAAAREGRDGLESWTSIYIKGFVLHSEVSAALRQKRSMHPGVYSFVKSAQEISLPLPGNFSSVLDSIGASLAELQALSRPRLLQRDPSSVAQQEEKGRACLTEAQHLDSLLRTWAKDVPENWRSRRLMSGKNFDSSIPAYLSGCDIYPSCQVATLWNLSRFHRLLLLQIAHMSSVSLEKSASGTQCIPDALESAVQATALVQGLVDDICHSVPFYLGNRVKPSSLDDFTDAHILFPSYHSLVSGGNGAVLDSHDGNDGALSEDEHRRHMIAYGAWHALSPLSNLLTLISSDTVDGCFVASCLRPGQHEWIRGQFLRVRTLLRLPGDSKSAGSAAECLARQVRKGTLFMSGP